MYWLFLRYFGKRFKDILDRYGQIQHLEAPLGEIVPIEVIEPKNRRYKALTVTHVDTSTG
jgi:alanine-glyoxylate transaminase/serine-glyoxylate transaminase/serine-pyruvate transaminase